MVFKAAEPSVVLAAKVSFLKAGILALWGLLVVSMIDNVLYPMLVGEEIRIHTALVCLAIAGRAGPGWRFRVGAGSGGSGDSGRARRCVEHEVGKTNNFRLKQLHRTPYLKYR